MARHFHHLKIKKITKETPECVTIEFDITENLWPYFVYKHGQNVTIKTHLDTNRRTYSISSSPLENKLAIAVKKVPNGVFSAYALEKLKEGDMLEVMEPAGSFYSDLKYGQKKSYLFFAAGSGITPIISIIKSVLDIEPESTVTLFYGNRNVASIIYKEELEGLKNKYFRRFSLTYIISREPADSPLNSGRIDEEKLKAFEKIIDYSGFDEVFICGPEQMIFTVRDFMKARGITDKNIHFELFVGQGMQVATQEEDKKTTGKKEVSSAEVSDVTIILDGHTYEIKVPYSKPTILDAGLDDGIDLPYSCKSGVCTTCRAKLLEGEVEMDVNYGLEDYEVEEGYILTCQSHPRTPSCKVDYDQ